MIADDPLYRPVYCLRVLYLAEPVAEDKPRHSVDVADILTCFLLRVTFFDKRLADSRHHRYYPDTGYGLWKGYMHDTFGSLRTFFSIIYQAVVNIDPSLFQIDILPAQPDHFAHTHPSSEHYRKKRQPMAELRRFLNISHKGTLLFEC